jgi:hypothetical protein
MKEEFLHAAWQFGLFDKNRLLTDQGDEVEVIHPGIYNRNSGPDFFNGRIRLNGIQLAGNIEIHIKSDDWYAHGHEMDAAYENVILHVVWDTGKPVKCRDRNIPTLSIKNKVWPRVLENYNYLMGSMERIPCEKRITAVPDGIVRMWLTRMTAERLQQKAETAKALVSELKYSPEQAFFILLAGNFGFHVNKAPFEELARLIDVKLFAKHKSSLFQIEALLFGCSGLLDRELPDAYAREMQKEYSFLRLKYGLSSMNPAAWKFGRTRPANFPSIRMAQLAALIFQSKFLMSSILEAESAASLRKLFSAKPSPYWQERYDFGKPAKKTSGSLSDASIDLLLVNTVAPFLYFSGIRAANEEWKEKALSILESVKPEQNRITSIWREAGFAARCAADSQGMIHLFRQYCSNKLCLQCAVGNKILSEKVS